MKHPLTLGLLALTCAASPFASFASADDPVTSASSSASASTSAATSAKPEFRGMMATADEQHFLLSFAGTDKSRWVAPGDTYEGWKVTGFDSQKGVLSLTGEDGKSVDLSLANGNASQGDEAPAKASVADAQKLLDKMHFGEMLTKMLESQKKAQLTNMKKVMLQKGMSEDEVDSLMARQSAMMDKVYGSLNSSDLQNEMSQIYSDVYTADELSGISQFYDTAAGQATLEKAPEIQQRLMAVMMPKIMAAAMQQRQQAAPPPPAAAAAPASTQP